jgi:putative MATE family efflux protein
MSGTPRRGDLTQGPIGRTLLMFALPTLGANILQSLNASINMVWVGRFLGENALAATSNASNVLFLMISGAFGFGMASTVLIGQHMGRRDIDGVRRTIGAAVAVFLLFGVAASVSGWLLTDRILHFLATPPGARELASIYLHYIFLSVPPLFMLTLLMMGLRGTGDSMSPLLFMILSVVLDAGLNPFLIAGIGPFPRLGIEGAAVATIIANFVSAAGLIAFIYARDLPLRLRGREWRYLLTPGWPLLRLILSRGIAMGLQMTVLTLAGITMIGLINRAGVTTVAAYGVASQLWNYVQMPAMAVGAAVSAMAAQNIGAGRWDRVNAITRHGIIANIGMTGLLVGLLMFFNRQVVGLFLGMDSPALPIAEHIQHIAGWSFIISGIMMVWSGVVRANGIVIAPLIIMTVAFLPGRLGFAFATQHWLGTDGLWWSYPFGSVLVTFLTWLYYHYGDWRSKTFADIAERAEHAELAPVA